MNKFIRTVFRLFLTGTIFCVLIVAITATTGFRFQKNPMDHFYAQHQEIDSLHISAKIPKQLILEDIDFLIKTLEAVHPNPYYFIEKKQFHILADSIKLTISDEIDRKELLKILTSLVNSINDGHTCVKFPEISKDQDNEENFKKQHSKDKELTRYQTINKTTGSLWIKDFAMDKGEFKNRVHKIFQQIQHDSISNLIIDLRDNPGGNSELAEVLISYIYDKPYKSNSQILIKRSEQYHSYLKGYFSWWFRPFLRFIKQINDYSNTPIGDIYIDTKGGKNVVNRNYRFHGKKYLLINSNTFSTALGFATVFKDYNIGKIVGEPTKSEVNEFGDIYPFDLPNSELWVWCSAKRYIRPSGKMTVGGLKPDIYIEDKNDQILKYVVDSICQ
ncbi:MAG: S41 family peptidase [Bacteroidales bacterium]|nr:S41 family peptidase [Bacteroidales bacterium]